MSGAQIALLCGLGAGVGLVMLASRFLQRAPDLAAALARLDTSAAPTRVGAVAGASGRDRFDDWAVRTLSSLRFVTIPQRDLAMIDRTPRWFATRKISSGLIGAVYVLVLSMIMTAVTGAAGFLPVGGLLVGAASGFVLPDASVRRQAARRRIEMRRALSSYVDLIALARLAGSGGATMLETPAQIAHGWAFRRIDHALRVARLRGQRPWEALETIAFECDIPELADLAVTARQAGIGGDPVAGQLLATAKQLRAATQQAAEKEARNAATAVWIPASAMVLVFMIFLMYPFASRL